ncbi:hypothetical protein D3C73_1314940 [compost metagenome]
MSEVMALNSCELAIPARIICVVADPFLPLAATASSATNRNAVSAPINAPSDMLIIPAPSPVSAISTAPVDAPAEIPSR